MTTLEEDAPPAVRDMPALAGDLFVCVFGEEGVSERLAASGVVLTIEFTDLDRTLVVDLPQRRVDPERVHLPVARVGIRSGDLNRYLQGDLNLMAAIGGGDVEVSGAIARALATISPEIDELRRLYRTVLHARGRTDLLV